MVPAAGNNTICRINSHFSHKEFKGVLIDIHIIYKPYRVSFDPILYTVGDLFDKTFAKVTFNIQLGVPGDLDHVCSNTFILKNIKDGLEIESYKIIKQDYIFFSIFFRQHHKAVNTAGYFNKNILFILAWLGKIF